MFKIGDRVEIARNFYNAKYRKGAQGIVMPPQNPNYSGQSFFIRFDHDGFNTGWPKGTDLIKLCGPKYKRNLPSWW